jgi:hypothetical protein
MKKIFILVASLLLAGCQNSDEVPSSVIQKTCQAWAPQLATLQAKNLDSFSKMVVELVTQNTLVQSRAQLNTIAECLDHHFKIICDQSSCRTERIN